jgi:Domain of unknown function (DUF4175)
MPHPLQHSIAALARRARRLTLSYALCWFLSALVAAVGLLALADYLVRFDDRGIRAMCSLAALAAAVLAARRYLWGAAMRRYGDIDVALRIERRFPALRDRLASAVQFLNEAEGDPFAGSPALRRMVVAEATADVGQLELNEAIDTRPARRAGLLAAGVCLIAALLAVADPSSTGTALARLANPLNDVQWPKVHQLRFVEPVTRVALGQTFEVELVDAEGVSLPDEVRMHYRYDEGDRAARDEVEAMQFIDGRMVARKESVSQPFSYRAEGGDDRSMGWTKLEVVEPPAVESLAIKLHYPEYTGFSPQDSQPHLRAPAGTRVAIRAATTKPLRSATLRTDVGLELAAAVAEDGYSFTIPASAGGEFLLDKTGTYWFDLEDREGFHGGQQTRYEMRVLPDAAPTVDIEQPKANIFVTPAAVVPLRILVKDDLAIHQIALVYLRSDRSDKGEIVQLLADGPAKISPQRVAAISVDNPQGESRLVEHGWNLAALELKPGMQVMFHATATDYRPQTGQSSPRRLSIISAAELQDRLTDRQTFILSELARVLKLEQESRGQVSGLELQLNKIGALSKPDVDALQGARLTQQQVDRELVGSAAGIPAHIHDLLADLENNKVDSPDVERQMQGMLREIARLADGPLPTVAREMTAAQKAAQLAQEGEAPRAAGPDKAAPDKAAPGKAAPGKAAPATAVSDNVAPRLSAAGKAQDEVIGSLERMLGELAEWDNYRRFHRDIGQLRQDQEHVAGDTATLGRQTLSKDVKDLDVQQQADLAKLGLRQAELARRFDKIRERMEQMAASLRESDPLAAEAIADALAQARQQGVAGRLREAGTNVERNQIGQAAARQSQAIEDLKDLMDTLANRRETELSRLVKKLRQAEQKLAELSRQQQGLRKQIRDAAKKTDEAERRRELERLAREEKRLEEDVQRFARQLQRLQAEKAGQSVAKAGEKMSQSGEKGQQGQGESAAEAADAAQRDLEEAQQELAQQRQQAEMDLAQEQLAKLETALASMHERQQGLLAETEHYEQIRTRQGRFSRAEALSVSELARQEQTLAGESQDLAKSLVAAEVFQFVLDAAARDMTQATERLSARDTGEPAQRAERSALERIAQVLDAMKPDGQQQAADEPSAGEGGQGGQGGGGSVRSMAEIKLLKLMQEQLNGRTRALELARDANQSLTDDQRREVASLAEEQGRLADLLLDMVKPEESKPEDSPERLPTIGQDGAGDAPPEAERKDVP